MLFFILCIYKIRSGCYLKNEEIRIDAHLIKVENLTKFYLSNFNLTSNLNLTQIKWHSQSKLPFIHDQTNTELENINKNIDMVKIQEVFPEVTKHDIHHYTVIYFIMLIMLLIAITSLIVIRLKMSGYILQNDTPAQPTLTLGTISPNLSEQIYSNDLWKSTNEV